MYRDVKVMRYTDKQIKDVQINSCTSSELNESGDYDEYEGEQLGEGEDVLNEGCPLDFPAVDECQHA